jgi:hypothetical protein
VTASNQFVEGLLLGAGGLIIVSAPLPAAQAFQGLALLRGQEELTRSFGRLSAALDQFARELAAALMQQANIEAQLVQLTGARTGGHLCAMGLVGGVDFRFRRPNSSGGDFHGGVGPGAPLLGHLLRLFAER